MLRSVVNAGTLDPAADAEIMIGVTEMSLSDIRLAGAALDLKGEMLSTAASGRVDKLMFRNVKVNGIAVDIEDVTDDFSFEKGKVRSLSNTLYVKFSPVTAAKAGLAEITASRTKWDVSGTVFVFCRAKKFGFSFKRVVPIKFSLNVDNPLL
jgi:hypothetical protein